MRGHTNTVWAVDKYLLKWWISTFDILYESVVLHPFGVKLRQMRRILFVRIQSMILLASDRFFLFLFSRFRSFMVICWMYRSNVRWYACNKIRGGVYISSMSIAHDLEWFEHVEKSFAVFTLFFEDLDENRPVTAELFSLLYIFRRSSSKDSRENINTI